MSAVTLSEPLAGRAAGGTKVALNMREGVNTIDIPVMPEGVRLKPSYTAWDESYFAPAHRHTFDQVRYLISGRQKVGAKVLSAGDLLYVPEGAFYGPQMTDDDPEHGRRTTHVSVQLPGPSCGVYLPIEQQRAATAQLSKTGKFHRGLYTCDDKTIDAFEAVHTQATGAAPDYPKPRVDGAIIFHTHAIPWRRQPGIESVWVKHVAHLNDLGPAIKLVKLEPGASIPVSSNRWDEIRFVIEGTVSYQDGVFPAPSGFYSPDYLRFSPMTSETGAIILIVQIAREWKNVPPLLAL